MLAARFFATMLWGHHLHSPIVTAGACVCAALTAGVYLLLSHRSVSIATCGILPIVAISVAIVAVVSITIVGVSYSIIYQGSILILTELANQLGFQS